jgi:ubiquinone/menaquinone biosynthesis C-methylase UbiE
MEKKGIFTISIDLELAWSDCDKVITERNRDEIGLERDIVKRMLRLFTEYNIRATWAIVGHLLLEECNWQGGKAHPEISRPVIKNSDRDWFFQHPKIKNDPLWYGMDLVEWIKGSFPRQDFASHSFCHMSFDEKLVNRRAVESDIEMAKRLHEAYGLPFEVFVFPRNIVGYRDLLAKSGIGVYRGKTKRWYDNIAWRTAKRLLNLSYFTLAIHPKTVVASLDEYGMINIPDSMLLLGREGLRKIVSPRNLVSMGMRGLDQAVKNKEIFHLWFHPSNFTHNQEEQLKVLESILKHAKYLEKSGLLEILTMNNIGKMVALEREISLKRQVTEDIRNMAITHHDQSAEYFHDEYRVMESDYFMSAFSYGRKKIEKLLDDTLGALPKASKVLDVGCGTGEQLKRCHNLGFDIMGVEPSAQMRAIAQRQNPKIKIVDGVINKLNFTDNSFDFIISIEVLRYLHRNDILAAYREMLRVLKPGGLMFFTMLNRHELNGYCFYRSLKNKLFRMVGRQLSFHCEFVTPNQIKNDLNTFGVREIKFYGRVFAPLLIAYKINKAFGRYLAHHFERFDDLLSQKKWSVPLAGHLIVIAKKP